jgi:hypothetical protein
MKTSDRLRGEFLLSGKYFENIQRVFCLKGNGSEDNNIVCGEASAKFTLCYFRISFPVTKNILKAAALHHVTDKRIVANRHHRFVPDEVNGRNTFDVRC